MRKTVIDLNIRKKYNLTIIGIKNKDGYWVPLEPDFVILKESILLAVTDPQYLNKLTNK